MAHDPPTAANLAAASPPASDNSALRPSVLQSLFTLRKEAPLWQTILFGALCIALCFGAWWWVTLGEAEERIFSPAVLPSPGETFRTFYPGLWVERELTRNIYASLRRVALGFGLATIVGVPVGILCGCFSWARAFFAPLAIFGRNIPVAALIPLTFSLFGIGESQKVMFIFIAVVAFIISDTAAAIADVGARYIDTAYTLGASRWQVILKVLVPLSLPAVFNSLRLLFGLAFGYIMLAELVKFGGESGGLGDIIITSQRRGPKEHILLVLLIIPIVALAIDRILYWVQRELFPHQYGGAGLLNVGVRLMFRGWEDVKGAFWKPADAGRFTSPKSRRAVAPSTAPAATSDTTQQ